MSFFIKSSTAFSTAPILDQNRWQDLATVSLLTRLTITYLVFCPRVLIVFVRSLVDI
jgi:hypothetical protein